MWGLWCSGAFAHIERRCPSLKCTESKIRTQLVQRWINYLMLEGTVQSTIKICCMKKENWNKCLGDYIIVTRFMSFHRSLRYAALSKTTFNDSVGLNARLLFVAAFRISDNLLLSSRVPVTENDIKTGYSGINSNTTKPNNHFDKTSTILLAIDEHLRFALNTQMRLYTS